MGTSSKFTFKRTREMKLLRCLVGAAAAQSTCSPGTATGIDVNGNVDPWNTNTCYLTKDAAYVASCNNDNDKAEMLIKIDKDFFKTNLNFDGFELDNSGNHYERVIGFDDKDNVRTVGNDVELFYSVEQEADSTISQGLQIYTTNTQKISFSCAYSLASQTVSNNFEVFGKSINVSRAQRGNLVFDMIVTPNVNIGARLAFSIVPRTPGAVYFTTKDCKVQHEALTYNLIYEDGNSQCIGCPRSSPPSQCMDDVTEFEIDTVGWSTSQQQDFSFNSFKFTAPGSRGLVGEEKQTISCDIHPSMELDQNYNPVTCGPGVGPGGGSSYYLASYCARVMGCTCLNPDGTCCSSELVTDGVCVSSATLIDENGLVLDETNGRRPELFDLKDINQDFTYEVGTDIMVDPMSLFGRRRRNVPADCMTQEGCEEDWGHLIDIGRPLTGYDTDECKMSIAFNSLTGAFRSVECVGDKSYVSYTGAIFLQRSKFGLQMFGRNLFTSFNQFKVGAEKNKKGKNEIYITLNGDEVWRAPLKQIGDNYKKLAIEFCRKNKSCLVSQVKNLNIRNY